MRDRRPLTYREVLARNGSHRLTRGYTKTGRGVWVPDGYPSSACAILEQVTTVCPHAVATGWLAAAIHGHPWADVRPPHDMATGDRQIRRPGIRSRHFEIPSRHIQEIHGPGGTALRVADPDWTTFDLARLPTDDTEALVALDGADRILHADPRRVLPALIDAYPDYRGRSRARRRLERCRPLSESPRETRLRVFAEDNGVTGLVVQYRVPGLPYRLDLALPDELVALEYDGAGHRDAETHARDVVRWNALQAAGWITIPVTSMMLRHDPQSILRDFAAARARNAARRH